MKIPKVEPPKYSNDAYWAEQALYPKLPEMKQRCDDCAITTGFYTPFADELLEQPREIQEKCVGSWFCHNHANRACKGAEEYVLEGKR